MNRILVLDTTLRDGEQAPGNFLGIDEKVTIAIALENAGIDIIDVGFPASNLRDFQAVNKISISVKRPIICVLARAIKKDIDIAVQSLANAKFKRIQTGISTSEIHLKSKLKLSKEEAIDCAVRAVRYAKKSIEDVQFYAEDAGRTDNEYLAKVIEKVIKAGATVVNIPDTTGFCLPAEYAQKINFLLDNVKGIHNVTISTHCHNDLGLATANTLYGVLNGARQIELSINGVGERAGNAALEEVLTILNYKLKDKFTTNFKLTEAYGLSLLVAKLMNHPIPRNKPVVGSNCFSHTSGIHQDGILKNPLNYEILSPKDVGQGASKIILSDKSGRAALYYSFKKLGYNIQSDKLNELYEEFISLSAIKYPITDKDLKSLITKNDLLNDI
jgi:2-isopropylmalate synthase